MVSTEELLGLAEAHLYPNYRKPNLVFVRGEGVSLFDSEGRRYLDFCAGIAVNTLGHAHPELVRRLSEQAGRLLHVSNYFHSEPNIRAAALLSRATGYARAFFCNSGTEAIEACLKLARRHFFARGEKDRLRVLAFTNSFHGRTLGALAATGQNTYREGFGPLLGVTHVPFGDLGAVRAALGGDLAAILVEPVQGEGGVIPAPPGFLAELRRLCDETGALLLADEVQTGLGRTGKMLAMEHHGVRADAVALAKGLGSGVPVGAMVCGEDLSQALPPGSHGTTFGGNALSSTAALVTLEQLLEGRLCERALDLGHLLTEGLRGLAARFPNQIAQVRGQGLLQALVLAEGVDARAVLERARDKGLLLTLAGGTALRITPPLIISETELQTGLRLLSDVLGELYPCHTS